MRKVPFTVRNAIIKDTKGVFDAFRGRGKACILESVHKGSKEYGVLGFVGVSVVGSSCAWPFIIGSQVYRLFDHAEYYYIHIVRAFGC